MNVGHLFGQYKLYIIIVLGALIAVGVWWGFSTQSAPDSLLSTEKVADAPIGDRALIDTLLQLRAVTLSGTVFSDPAFMSLQDFGTQIVVEPIGRQNPFAPIAPEGESSRSAPPSR